MRSIQNECKTFFTRSFCDLRTDVYDPFSSCGAQERDCTTPERFLALIIWAVRKTKTLSKGIRADATRATATDEGNGLSV